MKTLFKKFETFMVAAAFAEEGDFKTAREMLRDKKPIRQVNRKVLRAE